MEILIDNKKIDKEVKSIEVDNSNIVITFVDHSYIIGSTYKISLE